MGKIKKERSETIPVNMRLKHSEWKDIKRRKKLMDATHKAIYFAGLQSLEEKRLRDGGSK